MEGHVCTFFQGVAIVSMMLFDRPRPGYDGVDEGLITRGGRAWRRDECSARRAGEGGFLFTKERAGEHWETMRAASVRVRGL